MAVKLFLRIIHKITGLMKHRNYQFPISILWSKGTFYNLKCKRFLKLMTLCRNMNFIFTNPSLNNIQICYIF